MSDQKTSPEMHWKFPRTEEDSDTNRTVRARRMEAHTSPQLLGEKLAMEVDASNFSRTALKKSMAAIIKHCALDPTYWMETLGFSQTLLMNDDSSRRQIGSPAGSAKLPQECEVREVTNELFERYPETKQDHIPVAKIRNFLYAGFLKDMPGFKKRILSTLMKEKLPLAAYFIRIYLSYPIRYTTQAILAGRKEPKVTHSCPSCGFSFLSRSKTQRFCSKTCKENRNLFKVGRQKNRAAHDR